MGILLISGIIIGALIAIILIGGLLVPKHYVFEKTMHVKASREKVWGQLNNFGSLVKWMPWMRMDPLMESGIDGQDGTPGAKYWWKGNKQVGEGSMTFKSFNAPEKTVIDLHFLKPFESKALTTLKAAPDGLGTNVTWAMEGDTPYPMNFISKVFFNMEKYLDKDFGAGLSNLKEICEA
ncbi:MAG: SRPBCC family protein [Ferruginibacter sp.]